MPRPTLRRSRAFTVAIITSSLTACTAVLGLLDVPEPVGKTTQPVSCLLNSDCVDADICIFKSCSPPCNEDVDCADGSRCLRTLAGTACVAPTVAVCNGSDCPAGTVCRAGACRNECATDAGCLASQSCSADHVCVSKDARREPPPPATGGPCSLPGACVPAATEACGTGGTRTCSASCEWSACTSQSCEGNTSQACGNCGTQTRTCNNGAWSGWSACSNEGLCAPNATQACANGTQTCGGSCQWGACVVATCAGASAEACGNCGTRTRTCTDGTWGAWSACMGQGVCTPNVTQACGQGGTQTCGGLCQWGTCLAQTCAGAASQVCGNCGTQTRTCNNGTWSGWSNCTGEGVCAPSATQACGADGSRSCSTSCQWGTCNCIGSMSQACGVCGAGSQTRSCNGGTWSAFSTCSDPGCGSDAGDAGSDGGGAVSDAADEGG